MTISAQRVHDIFMDCFHRDTDVPEPVIVQALMGRIPMNQERVEDHRAEITAMLSQLDDSFMASKGGGMSLMNAVMDRHGEQWTGFQQRAGELFAMGTALGVAKLLLAPEMWSALPGGMPYYSVIDK